MSSAVLPAPIPPVSVAESLAEVLANVVGVERVPPGAHIFDNLGVDSTVMTRLCARVRKRTDLPSVSIKEMLVGRWKVEEIQAWSLPNLRNNYSDFCFKGST
jgi:hypothetical protein